MSLITNKSKQMMTEVSPVQNRQIAKSLGKLQKAASESRFRIKSFRVKTSQNQKADVDRGYETDLNQLGYSKQFLKSLYVLKSDQNQLKITEAKYLAFIRTLHQKIMGANELQLFSLNFHQGTAELFLKEFTKANKQVVCLDLSNCTFLSGHSGNSGQSVLIKSIFKSKRIVQVKLKNMALKNEEIQEILNKVIETEKIFDLDVGNDSSQSMNRISDNLDILYDFFKRNIVTAIVRLENLSIKKAGVEKIQKGLLANAKNPLKILSLKNNAISEQASLHITMLAKTGILNLDISENPLGPNFYLNLPSWKSSTINTLDVSSTNMNSEALIYFLNRLEENKAIQNLKMDRNNFSNNWFSQIKEAFQVNTSIQTLSMVDCSIKRMNEGFAGLYHNRYLRKLNISGSQFEEGAKELCELLKLNKNLNDLRLRFCGLKTDSIIKIFHALSENMTLNYLDISENQMGDQGAKQAIRCLNTNSTLSTLSIQKTQVQIRLKKQIQQKLKANKLSKKNKQFNRLKKENNSFKEADVYSWEDVTTLQNKVRTNNNNIRILQSNIGTLDKKFQKKRMRYTEIVQEYTERHTNLKVQIENLEKKMMGIDEEEAKLSSIFKKKEIEAMEAAQKEEEAINALEEQIRTESVKNQKRQNQLQDQFENKKYMKKKEGGKKESSAKTGFDTSAALNSKRKSRNF